MFKKNVNQKAFNEFMESLPHDISLVEQGKRIAQWEREHGNDAPANKTYEIKCSGFNPELDMDDEDMAFIDEQEFTVEDGNSMPFMTALDTSFYDESTVCRPLVDGWEKKAVAVVDNVWYVVYLDDKCRNIIKVERMTSIPHVNEQWTLVPINVPEMSMFT